MKLRLPLGLLAAVVSAAGVVYAGEAKVAEVADTVYWVGIGKAKGNPTVVTPEYVGDNVDEIKTELTDAAVLQSKYKRPVVFDSTSEGSATIENWGTSESPAILTSGLFVREGELTLKDSNVGTNLGQYQSSICVSGNNAVLVMDGTTMKSGSGSQDICYIGGQSGAGKMVLKGGSEINIDTWVLLGISKYSGPQGYSGYITRVDADAASATYTGGEYTEPRTPNTGDTTDEKRGAYNDFNSNHEYGKGVLEVIEGSKLTMGGALGLREADVTVSGEGSLIETCTKYKNGPSGNHEEKSDLVARGSGSVSHINILDGGKWHSHGWFTTASLTVFESKSYITVDGEGSELRADAGLGLGYGVGNEQHDTPNVSSTEMYVTNGGKVSAADIYVGLGEKNLSGSAYNRRGANPVYLYIDAASSMLADGKFRINKAVNGLNYKVDTEGFDVNVVNEGTISCTDFVMDGGNLYSSGVIEVTNTLTLNGGTVTLGISSKNEHTASISVGSLVAGAADGADYEVHLQALENMKAGKYLIIENAAGKQRAAFPGITFVLDGDFADMTVQTGEDGNLYLMLEEQIVLVHDPLADAVQAANWGVQKSSRAFTGLLWQPHGNAVVLGAPSLDAKGAAVPVSPTGTTLAWGSAYSGFSRHSASGGFSGAEYSLWGGAVGVERRCVSGGSIGFAVGYDWGKVSPHSTARVEQDSWHAALYGRAADWKTSAKGSVAIDWSAAVGSTTSEQENLGDWTQKNLQLDARVTYGYSLNDRTTATAFAGAQYYAQENADSARVQADSLQYLRLMLGAGLSHKLTDSATVYGEVSVYNDTMRHNPEAGVDGFYYGSGANPGRLGGSVTAGAQYQLNENWSLWGSYSFEGTDDNSDHRVNVGASYSF